MPSPRKLIYLSGTRADFGLMRSTLRCVAREMDLSVVVTGMHLDRRFGHTVDEVEACGLRICGRVPVDLSDRDEATMARVIGHCLIGVTEVLQREKPDVLLLLGDRGEMLAGAIAALHLGIATVHIHGGERSGTVDEPVRHAISKLCTYHFVASEESRTRLIRMGEVERTVFVTGAPGLDDMLNLDLPDTVSARRSIGLAVDATYLLVAFHPVVQQAGDAGRQTLALIQAIGALGLPVVWIEPNADAGSWDILDMLDRQALPAGSVRRAHLERPVYFAALRDCAALLGNSSAGIIEAASFGTPVVNVGDRQRLRERNGNVVDVEPDADAIERALREALARGRWNGMNRFGTGDAGPRIVALLKSLPIDGDVLEKINAY